MDKSKYGDVFKKIHLNGNIYLTLYNRKNIIDYDIRWWYSEDKPTSYGVRMPEKLMAEFIQQYNNIVSKSITFKKQKAKEYALQELSSCNIREKIGCKFLINNNGEKWCDLRILQKKTISEEEFELIPTLKGCRFKIELIEMMIPIFEEHCDVSKKEIVKIKKDDEISIIKSKKVYKNDEELSLVE